jgi:hypothetical protein
MELRQLRYLVALADEHNFTRAAAREHIAQPALSQQIRRLEDQAGLALVERTTSSVRLTDAGERPRQGAARVRGVAPDSLVSTAAPIRDAADSRRQTDTCIRRRRMPGCG